MGNFVHQRELEKDIQKATEKEKREIKTGLYKTGKGDREKLVLVVAVGVSIVLPNGLTARNNVLYCTEHGSKNFSEIDGRQLICCSAARFLEVLPDGSRRFEKVKG